MTAAATLLKSGRTAKIRASLRAVMFRIIKEFTLIF
jgi:hypothetical protein